MNIKVLSIEEWNLHPAVEMPFPENKKDAPMYRLEAGWYHGGLGLPILSDGSVCIDALIKGSESALAFKKAGANKLGSTE